ncbi:hypothetical protein Bca52824_084492 [Brassica carinata]|uniref:Uncharacterized protein n=1 Tax=Brassica carinata TaxID=52824 RepID=A0A8X7TUU4_BRACI|nr:hypothetical protein Bca52824_084492 [Brassica carinata]
MNLMFDSHASALFDLRAWVNSRNEILTGCIMIGRLAHGSKNTADGKTNRDNSHADPIAWKFQRRTSVHGGDGIDEAENVGLIGEGGDESPISGLNLLAEEVENGTWSDNVYKDPQENGA